MSTPLPGPMSFEEFARFRADSSLWLEAAIEIARSHGLPTSELHVFSNGSNLVAALDEKRILKIFPPMLRHQFESERASLLVLDQKLSIPVPEVIAEGERDQWPYLIFTRLSGQTGESVWSKLPEDQKEHLLKRIGEVIAEVQGVSPGPLLELEPKWDAFVPKQIAGCRARHERLGLPRQYLEGLEEYLHEASSILPLRSPMVILTGEYIPENFLVTENAGSWQLSGLIDFGDVMTGWKDYDLVGPSTFMAAGHPGRIRSLLEGFGYSEAQMTAELRRRLMTLFLLHRYSDLNQQIRIEDWQKKARTLPELERLLWPIGL